MFQDQRAFLRHLEEQGELRTLDVPIRVTRNDNELMALSRYLSINNVPAVKLTNLEGYNTPGVPVYIGNIGSRKRMCLALEVENWGEAKEKLAAAVKTPPESWPEPVIVDPGKAPCKEVIIRGDDIDLQTQVPKVWFGEEWSAMISDNVSVTRDPDTGTLNASALLHSFLDLQHDGTPYSEELRRRCLISYIFWKPPTGIHVAENYANAVKRGKPLEIAIASCIEPQLFIIGGGPRCPRGSHAWDKYAMVGALRGGPTEIVRCETVDLYVPATSEWVLEGEVLPDQELADYKHGNFLGYYNEYQLLPVTKINCITRRRDPIWHPSRSFMPPYDHGFLQLITIESEVLSYLRSGFPQVQDVVAYPSFGGRGMFYVVQLNVDAHEKPYAWFGHQIIHAVWGSPGRYGAVAKYVVVVGPDIDPYSLDEVIWALNTRVQPKSDTIFNDKGQVLYFDPSALATPQGNTVTSEQLGIDATFKLPERFTKLHQVPARPPKEAMEKIKAKVAPYLT
ncbi:MAG: UbiD family decarboxylase [Candidatus Tectomicrobia bacterium]|nr:UbiD family decarboxylase [Candidatus Tectomicrobia bacterium]